MNRDRNPQTETRENVFIFRPVRRGRNMKDPDVVRASAEGVLQRREDRIRVWSRGMWVCLAWILAMSRLASAAQSHDVFDAETSLAFVVAALMPLLFWKSIQGAVRGARVALGKVNPDKRAKPRDRKSVV